MIVEKLKVKKGTVICRMCRKVIDKVDSPIGGKIWFGICQDCSEEKSFTGGNDRWMEVARRMHTS